MSNVFIYTKTDGSILNNILEQEEYIRHWLSTQNPLKKTLLGKNKTLYLKSEVDQHYVHTYSDEIVNINKTFIIDYYK
jgi:hypothetical protein